ncbi:hypothetical protein BLS_006836 [Venturia inaequalis]|uniref:Uncharacterized protein n=1 Tax=Venturia inaequalis TaxID=5025 RepID=A0A8H3YZ10_VENIN|nr:hypothetical protein EG328_003576 [Venturia inaequalis]KAE9981924.1 hypothetical protein BLS_006836 [Venturia inaequalis]KAE9993557.1 hypothetical protein EG327_004316 [Venturia inaequalis]RDI79235.1 hypothetical protein Vi05172_g10771 [Venturia inaequalis]
MQVANASKPRVGQSPWTASLDGLLEYGAMATAKSSKFGEMSSHIFDHLTSMRNITVLHIQPENHADHLLRLHILLQSIDKHRLFSIKERRDIPLGVIIIADSLNDQNNGFKQACWVASERTETKGKEKCGGAAYLFGTEANVVVVRGLARNNLEHFKSAVSRLGQAITNTMSGVKAKGIVWHECATITLLARTLQERNVRTEYFKAILCTSGLTFHDKTCTVGFGFKDEGARGALLNNLEKTGIPLILLDPSSVGHMPTTVQTSTLNMKDAWNPFASHLPYFSNQWPRLLPIDSWRPLLGQGMDVLVASVFRLRAACVFGGISHTSVVKQVKTELGPTKAAVKLVTPWAKKCIDGSSYTPSALMSLKLKLGNELWQSCLRANCPVEFPLDALVGGLVDPGTSIDENAVLALRVDVEFSTGPRVRASASTKIPTYVLVSTSADSGFVAEALNTGWESLMSQYPDPAKKFASIPKQIAESWEFSAIAMMKTLQAILKTEACKQWGNKDMALFTSLMQTVWGRDMTVLAAKTLRRHPMATFAEKR